MLRSKTLLFDVSPGNRRQASSKTETQVGREPIMSESSKQKHLDTTQLAF